MPSYNSNVGLALGTLAGELGSGYRAKKEREWVEEQKKIDFVSNLISAGLQSGRLENPDEAFQFMLEQFGTKGAKGKKGQKGELPPPLKRVLDATMAAGKSDGAGVGQVVDRMPARLDEVPQTRQAGAGAPPAAAAGGSALPPVPGAPRFRSASQTDAARRQEDIDRSWQDAGNFEEAPGKWIRVQTNGVTGETRKLPLPGAPEAVVKRPLGVSTFPGTVEGKDLAGKFDKDLYGNPIDPKRHYRQVKQNDSLEPVGVIPTEAPASEAPSRAKKQRVEEYMATHPGVDEAEATKQVDIEMRGDTVLKSNEERAKLANLWATVAGRQLTNDQKRRALNGQITEKDALQIARALHTSSGDKFSLDDVQTTANELMKRFGASSPKSAEPGSGGGTPKLPPVPGAEGKGSTTTAPASPTPGSDRPAAAGPAGRIEPVPGAGGRGSAPQFGKGRKLSAAAQRTVDTAKTVLDLIPHVEEPLRGAGVADDNDIAAMTSTRFADYLYNQGKSPDEWREEVIQYADSVRAFVLTGLLAGRSNKPLQDILNRHIPDPTKDTPLMMMRKLKNLRIIAQTAGKNAAEGATLTPDQVAKQFDSLPDPNTGAPKNPYRK